MNAGSLATCVEAWLNWYKVGDIPPAYSHSEWIELLALSRRLYGALAAGLVVHSAALDRAGVAIVRSLFRAAESLVTSLPLAKLRGRKRGFNKNEKRTAELLGTAGSDTGAPEHIATVAELVLQSLQEERIQ